MNLPIYCITTRQTPEREAAAQLEFSKHNLPVKMIYGIYGRRWGLTTTKPYSGDATRKICANDVGLNLTHYMIWTLASVAQHERFLVFEDDALLIDNFVPELTRMLETLPEGWQMVKLGCTGIGNDEIDPKWPHRGRFYEIGGYSTHAVLYHASALPILLETQQDTVAPVDMQLNSFALPRLRYYTYLPSLAQNGSIAGKRPRTLIFGDPELVSSDLDGVPLVGTPEIVRQCPRDGAIGLEIDHNIRAAAQLAEECIRQDRNDIKIWVLMDCDLGRWCKLGDQLRYCSVFSFITQERLLRRETGAKIPNVNIHLKQQGDRWLRE